MSRQSNRTASPGPPAFDPRPIDDAHMVWVAAEVESEHALRAWYDGAASDRTGAYLAYRAAVDREEAAARELRLICEHAWSHEAWLASNR